MIIHLFVLSELFLIGIQASTIDRDILEEFPEDDERVDLRTYRKKQLYLHNYYRALHGVPLLTEDATLTRHAQSYAEELAGMHGGAGVTKLIHCSRKPGCDNHNEGENLAMAWGSSVSKINAAKEWYDEVWFYDFCLGNDRRFRTNRPGHNGEMVGHFTQVVWRASRKLGIGYARNFDGTKVYVVGRYSPPGNIPSRSEYKENVPPADYIFNTYQDNCQAISGGYTPWSAPSECTPNCGDEGGVKLRTRACTNPQPSKNGYDCRGNAVRLASREWCHLKSCNGDKTHLDLQCEQRGFINGKGNFYSNKPCEFFCTSGTGMSPAGVADDGTHCKSGVCIQNKCVKMPKYKPQTNAAGQVASSYTKTPVGKWSTNIVGQIPNGVMNAKIINHDTSSVRLYIGYADQNSFGYEWSERYGGSGNVVGVNFSYSKSGDVSTITIKGRVQTNPRFLVFTLFASSLVPGTPADVTWAYTP